MRLKYMKATVVLVTSLVASGVMVPLLYAQGGNSPRAADVASSYQPLATYPPMAGFNPITASAAELAQNHFPPRPTSGPALTAWDATYGRATHYAPPDPVQGTNPVAPPLATSSSPSSAGAYNSLNSLNWSGYFITASSASAQAIWEQKPVAVGDDTNFETAPQVAFWTGLGGINTENLIQAGASSISTYPSAQYRFWTEDYPQDPVFEGPVIRPDDYAFVSVSYDGADSTTYFLEDQTTGNYSYFTNDTPYVDLTTTDCIAESPYDIWPDWGETTFTDCSGSEYALAPGVFDTEVFLYSSTGILRGTPGPVNGNNAGFNDWWKHE